MGVSGIELKGLYPLNPNLSWTCFVLQVKSGVSMMGLQFCGWPAGVLTSNVPFTSPLPGLGSGLALPEGNASSFLTSSVASSKSESPVPPPEKASTAQPAAVEVAKPVDFPSPKPIPEGRWKAVACSTYCISWWQFLSCQCISKGVLCGLQLLRFGLCRYFLLKII